ncbi:MAG: hypothetical protein AAF236_08690 [Verrucomicrobiota bacterium]
MSALGPMSGIKVSYRGERKAPTYVIPIAIGLLMIGLLCLFLMGDPNATKVELAGESEATPTVTGSDSTPQGAFPREQFSLPDESIPELETVSVDSAPQDSLPAASGESNPGHGRLIDSGVPEAAFTSWMSVAELDSYIKIRNAGFDKSFWDRGHWILAAEGRWQDGTHEYRIVIDAIPDISAYQWKYRINQTQMQFEQSIDLFLREGFQLVHSQSFQRPDGTQRYQGVWQRLVGADGQTLAMPKPPPVRTLPSDSPDRSLASGGSVALVESSVTGGNPSEAEAPIVALPDLFEDRIPNLADAPQPNGLEAPLPPPVIAQTGPTPRTGPVTSSPPASPPTSISEATGNRVIIPERRGSVIAPGALDVNNLQFR